MLFFMVSEHKRFLWCSLRRLRDDLVKELDAFGEGFDSDALIVAVKAATQFARRGQERQEAVTDDPQIAEVMAVSESGEHGLRQNRFGIVSPGDGCDGLIERGVGWRRVGFKGEERFDL